MANDELRRLVVGNSSAGDWEEARHEWDVVDEREVEPGTVACVCGHGDIRHAFTIRNRYTGRTLYPVGSTCVRAFGVGEMNEGVRLYRDIDTLMAEAERLGKGAIVDIGSGLVTEPIIAHLFSKGVLLHDEAGVLHDARGKRKRDDELFARANGMIKAKVYPWLRERYRQTRAQAADG